MKKTDIARAIEVVKRNIVGTFLKRKSDDTSRYRTDCFYFLKNDELETVWFYMSSENEELIKQQNNGKVMVRFADFAHTVELEGVAELFCDDETKKSLWQDFMYKKYPLGPLDPSFVIVKYTVDIEDSTIEKAHYHVDTPNIRPDPSQAFPPPERAVNPEDIWKCSCGETNNLGKFCNECAKPRPQPQQPETP